MKVIYLFNYKRGVLSSKAQEERDKKEEVKKHNEKVLRLYNIKGG